LYLGHRGPDDAARDGGGLAAAFVGVEAVVADGLLAFRREVEQRGGDEVGGFEDLEVAFGGVVAFGAVDDGFGGGVPGDFLEGKGMAQEVFRQTFTTGGVVGGDRLLLLGICFWREGLDVAFGPERRGAKGGSQKVLTEGY
jgi:hypothetical protein